MVKLMSSAQGITLLQPALAWMIKTLLFRGRIIMCTGQNKDSTAQSYILTSVHLDSALSTLNAWMCEDRRRHNETQR